ncbi:type II toxin-antitoxin system RelE/ParE family toxin [bacterium]|nr:type II toxin-antitoxin system RelE/ParE family toxin [bacterium]
MIKSFKHKGLERFFLTGSIKGIQANHQNRLALLLSTLNAMDNLEPLKTPSFRLHKLKGDMSNLWSITVQANWRITFEFDEQTQNVYIVDYQDYH